MAGATWDLEVHGGVWSRGRVTVCTEYHGGERRVLRVKTILRASTVSRLSLAVAIARRRRRGRTFGSLRSSRWERRAAVVAVAAFAREAVNLGRMLYGALQTVARRARLHYAPPLADGSTEEA